MAAPQSRPTAAWQSQTRQSQLRQSQHRLQRGAAPARGRGPDLRLVGAQEEEGPACQAGAPPGSPGHHLRRRPDGRQAPPHPTRTATRPARAPDALRPACPGPCRRWPLPRPPVRPQQKAGFDAAATGDARWGACAALGPQRGPAASRTALPPSAEPLRQRQQLSGSRTSPQTASPTQRHPRPILPAAASSSQRMQSRWSESGAVTGTRPVCDGNAMRRRASGGTLTTHGYVVTDG